MIKRIAFTSLAVCLLISACSAGATPPPTMDPMNIVNTAQAAAFTMIAETQAAIPTATFTEIPTATPLPTDTPIPSPTLPPTAAVPPTATAGAISSGDPCWHTLAPDAAGNPATLRIKNWTDGPITITVYLYQQTVFGECGYRVYDMSKKESITLNLVTGNYALTAWTNNRTKTAYGSAIISDNHLIDFEVYDDYIRVIYP